jgi:hypothetical protein
VFDDHLVRYCSGNPNDIEAMIDTLDALGFETIAESDGQPCWQDCCVVDHFGRATLPCDWLQLARDYRSAFLKARSRARLSVECSESTVAIGGCPIRP